MKKISLLAQLIAYLFLPYTKAQSVVNYVFSPAASTYTPITGGQPLPLSGNLNDGYANSIPIGFAFIYNSISYTTLSVSTNGFLCLGGNITNTANATNNLSNGGGTTSPRPIIAPLWDNLNFNTNSDLSYQTIGIAPNRTFIMQWQNARWGAAALNPGVSFQARLSEADGKIEFIYKSELGLLNAPSASIGISNMGSGQKNFLCLTNTSNNTFDTSTVIETTTLNSKPNNGQSYSFIPKFQVPVNPTILSYSSITGTQITLHWNDSSNTETYFLVYLSSDDINYNLVSSIASLNSAGLGQSYQQNLSDLVPGNRYYFRVYACSEGSLPINYTQGNTSTAAGLLSGTKTICPGACDYTSIGNACNDIRNKGVDGALILELMPSYLPSVETFPLVFGNLLTNNSNTITIRPNSAVSTPIKFYTSAPNTFEFNNTNYLSIDGQPGGSGGAEFIQICNINSSGSGVHFTNGSSNNHISHCRITGLGNTTNSGVVKFSGTNNTHGNSQNAIFNCTIKDTLNNPIFGIYSEGNTSYPNLYNSIYNNQIYNYHNGSNPSYGIFAASGSDAWFISNNSFFQTSPRTISLTYAGAIHLASGSNYSIIGNYIGGSAPNCSGLTTQYTGTGFVNFIRLNLMASNTNIILGNYIQNISLNWAGSAGINALIQLINGAFNISGNQLGSDQNNLKININNTTGTIDFSGIYLGGGSAYDETQISYNTLAGFTLGGSGVGNIQFAGIRMASGVPDLSIHDNLIGSLSQENNIQNYTKAYTYGIMSSALASQNTIKNNTIANIHGNNTDSLASVCGIFLNSTGSFSVTKNTIYKLLCRSVISQNANQSPVTGISHVASGPDQECSYNTIYHLYANNASNNNMNTVFGIKFLNSNTGTNYLSNNLVHTLHSTAANGSTCIGLYNGNSSTLVANNIVRLGLDSNGAAMSENQSFVGIQDMGNSNSYYHNSIYIAGLNAGANNLNSYAFFNPINTTGTRNIVNNIFYNNRSNFSGTGMHYALGILSLNVNGLTLNHNIYYAPNTNGFIGRINTQNISTLQGLRTYTYMDYNSGVGNPNFVNANGSIQTLSLKIQGNSAAEGSGILVAEIETDFEGELRGNNTPNDIGADAGNYTKVDIFSPIIDYSPLSNTSSTSNRDFTVLIKDLNKGVNSSITFKPRVYYRRLTPTTSTWQSTQGNLVSGHANEGVWNFTIDYTQTGTPVSLGHRYQYYVVAQDSVMPGNVFVYPFVGANHVNVNSMVTAPSNAFTYSIVSSLPTSLLVGTGQTYTNLTGATGLFAALNNGVLTGNTTATIVSHITEPGTVALSNAGLAGYNLLIKPDSFERVISGAVTTANLAMVCLDGANGVTIDGGTNKLLTFRNVIGTSANTTTAATIRIRSGSNDTIRNCIIEGNSANSAIGILNLGTSSIALASENLLIENNYIRPPFNDSSNAANTPIIINSAAGNLSNSIIIGNLICDYNTYGIYIANAGNNLQIGDSLDASKGNHFVQRRARNSVHYSMLIGSGNNHVIGYNKIYNLHGITHSVGLYGIYVYNGINNCLITHNSIGGNAANRGGEAFKNGQFYQAILANVGNLQTSRITHNHIGNIALSGSTGIFTGIYGIGGKISIENNTIGVDKINGNLYDSISVGQSFYGIRYQSASSVNIQGNLIKNIYNNGSGFLAGMSIENGIFTIQDNQICDLYTKASTNNSLDYNCVGIRISSARANNNIENNLIYNLYNSSNLNGTTVTGLAIMGAIKSSEVHRNRIYNLQATHTGLAGLSSVIRGIYIGSNGTCIYHNNQISLNQFIANTQPRIMGIDASSSGGTNQLFYNSIYIGGFNAGNNNSAAFYRNALNSTAAVELVNNILYNERAGGGSHFAISSNLSGNFIQDNNLFVAKSVGSAVEFPLGTARSFSAWNALIGNPIYNIFNTPTELEADSFFTNINNGNLASTSCRIANIGAYVSVQHDYSKQARSIPSDIGSSEFSNLTGMPQISSNPISDTITCAGGNAFFAIKAHGSGIQYQWQMDDSSGWLNLNESNQFMGVKKDSLHIISPNSALHAKQFRCIVSGICNPTDTSNAATLVVISTNLWTGAINTNWNVTGNWSCGVLPTPSTDAVIPNVSNLPIISDSTQRCYKLSIATGASVTLNNAAAKLEVYGTVDLNGNLIHNNGIISFSGNTLQNIPAINYHILEVNNSAGVQLTGNTSIQNHIQFVNGCVQLSRYNLSLLGNSSFIYGASSANKFIVTNDTGALIIQQIGSGNRTAVVQFPIGSNQNSFTPISIINTGTSDHFKARVIPQVYNQYLSNGMPIGIAYTANAVNKTWLLQESNAGGSNAQLSFMWNIADELLGFNRSSSYAARYGSTQWTGNTPSSASGTNPYFQNLGGQTQFSIFGVASGGILPVALLHFEAQKQEEDVLLFWKTAAEKNSKAFEIERSIDGIRFEKIEELRAAGNSNTTKNYVFKDTDLPKQKAWYYRLKLVDMDEQFTYSAQVRVNNMAFGSDPIHVFPNPFTGQLMIKQAGAGNQEMNIALREANGKVILQQKIAFNENYELSGLENIGVGMYILDIQTPERNVRFKLLKTQ